MLALSFNARTPFQVRWVHLVLLLFCLQLPVSGGFAGNTLNDSEASSTSKHPPLVRVIDISAMPPEERLTALALQGLANRRSMSVILQAGESVRWNSLDYESSEPVGATRWWNDEQAGVKKQAYPNVTAYWIAFCEKNGLATFKSQTLVDAIRELSNTIQGAIIFNNVDDDLAVVGTMAGIEQGLPMTPAFRKKLRGEHEITVPVIFDINSIYKDYDPKYSRRIEAHKWAVRHLLPKCDRSAAFSRDKTYDDSRHDTLIDIDLAIRNRWMTFDLTFLDEKTNKGFSVYKPDPVWGFAPPDANLLTTILESLDQPFPKVYGWGRPDEEIIVRRLAAVGAVLICTGAGNTSFLQSLPKLIENLKQPSNLTTNDVELEDKVYVCFAVNEGDTLKCLATLQNWGGWIQDDRGRIPINWGMDPILYKDFPGLVSYYLSTASKNDYFFLATSGWGYLAPDKLSTSQLQVYGAIVRDGAKSAGLNYGDIWYMDPGLVERDLFFPFLSATGLRGLTQKQIPGFARENFSGQWVNYAPDGTPIIYSDMYYDCFFAGDGGVKPATEKILHAADAMGAPWFVFVYGGSPHFFSEIAKGLPSEKFKIVAMDEFFAAARKARPKIEGRVFKAAPSNQRAAP